MDSAVDGTRATMFYNPETLKTNHWLHAWKIFSTSPFEQACVFTKDVTPAVTGVAVTPETATVYPNSSLQMTAVVTAAGFANKAVTWTVVNSTTSQAVDGVTIDANGLLKIGSSVAASTELTVTAKSVFNTSVSDTATITVGGTPTTTPETTPTTTPNRSSK